MAEEQNSKYYHLVQSNKRQRKVLLCTFYSNGHTVRFHSQTKILEPHPTAFTLIKRTIREFTQGMAQTLEAQYINQGDEKILFLSGMKIACVAYLASNKCRSRLGQVQASSSSSRCWHEMCSSDKYY